MALTQPIGPAENDTNGTTPADEGRVTPAMAQFVEIKAANPDCLLFYRMGDFYEMFFEDAEVASRALGIVFTKRGNTSARTCRCAAFPSSAPTNISTG